MNVTICLCWRYPRASSDAYFHFKSFASMSKVMSKNIVLNLIGKYYEDNLLMEFSDDVKSEKKSK